MNPLTAINNNTRKYRVDDTHVTGRIFSIVLHILHKNYFATGQYPILPAYFSR